MKALLGIVVALVVLGLLVGGAYVSARNQMVTLNEQVRSDWAQVDVVLQRRADLIPNLVETVKGFRRAGTHRFRGHRQGPHRVARRANTGRQDCRERALDGAMEIKVLALRRTIRSSSPTRISCACRTSSPAPKTAFPSSASATTMTCRLTTPTSCSSRITSFAGWAGFSATTITSPRRPRRGSGRRCSSLRLRSTKDSG